MILRATGSLLAGVLLLLLFACADTTGPERETGRDRTGVWIGQTAVILEVSERAQLTAIWRESEQTVAGPVTDGRWWTDHAAVLRVSGQGNVQALAPGRAVVWVEVGSRRDSATVQVQAPRALPRIRWRSVAVGWDHACALSEQGRAYCWGGGPYGELGSGAQRLFTTTMAPVAVSGGRIFSEIHAGGHLSCALEPDGSPWCWGLTGHTGAGHWDERNYARAVPERVKFPGTFSRLSVGFNHSCGLDRSGAAYCWGNNFYGQLGLGTVDGGRPEPTQVVTEQRFSQISLGFVQSCALTPEGAAYCWGRNQPPLVGHDEQQPGYALPEPVIGAPRFIELVASGTPCARDAEKRTWCWGVGPNVSGLRQDPANPHAPARLLEDPGFERIFTGRSIMCGLAADGSAHCWGSNLFSRMGTDWPLSETVGDYAGTPVPYSSHLVPIAGGHRWKQLSLGWTTSCGVTLEGELYCWGSNRTGILGIGSVDGHYQVEPIAAMLGHRSVPVRVADPL